MKKIVTFYTVLILPILTILNLNAAVIQITAGPAGTLTFSPATVAANVGDTIQWTWASGTHTTTSLGIPAGAAAWDAPLENTSTSFNYVVTMAGTYNYTCTPHAADNMTGTITVTALTGLETLTMEQLRAVSPNPFISSISIDLHEMGITKKTVVEVFDIAGKKFLTETANGNEKLKLGLEHLHSGIYFLSIGTKEKRTVYKIIKS